MCFHWIQHHPVRVRSPLPSADSPAVFFALFDSIFVVAVVEAGLSQECISMGLDLAVDPRTIVLTTCAVHSPLMGVTTAQHESRLGSPARR